MDDLKIKLAVLWLFRGLAWLSVGLLILYEPGGIEQIMAGEIYGMQIGPAFLLQDAVMLLVPLVMAFLSLILKDSINRWANIILGIVFTLLILSSLVGALTTPNPPAYAILLEVSAVVVNALIVWYAWKWPIE